MMHCMRAALNSANLDPSAIGYVGAHATGTEQGDAAEARAIGAVFGDDTPVSSLKGNLTHTLGASGPIELAATLEMLRTQTIYPTLHLDEVDPACGGVRHVTARAEHRFNAFLKNSFAFGGINTALVCSVLR
jgi:3-oxoacyl-[acyl-carrier-protein] synthase II